ncbi:MAG: hypothetical protein ABEJ04_00495 [Halobacteriaceae archaeon]
MVSNRTGIAVAVTVALLGAVGVLAASVALPATPPGAWGPSGPR